MEFITTLVMATSKLLQQQLTTYLSIYFIQPYSFIQPNWNIDI